MAFINCQNGNLKEVFISDYEIIDRYVGDRLFLWGSNVRGELGDNTTVDKVTPVQTVSQGTNWEKVSNGGGNLVFGLKTDGTLWIWGYNAFGQLGNNNRTNQSSPVQTVSTETNWCDIDVHYDQPVAIKSDGTLWSWGYNAYGNLGNNNIIDRSSPVQTVSTGTNWKQASSGVYAVGAIKTDGTLWLWGSNSNGQLGNNNTIDRSSPVQTVAQGTNWKYISSGTNAMAAIKTDGTLWLWGYNNQGGLGTNNMIQRSSPVQTVATGTNWKYVDMGVYSTAAIKTDGTLWTWGYNVYGQLGTNDTFDRSSPVQTVSLGTNWKQLVSGYNSSVAAIKTDGTLWTWGQNPTGILGVGDTNRRSSPVQTCAQGTYWKQVSMGANASAITHSF